MFKLLSSISVCCLLFINLSAQQSLEYNFRNNFDEQSNLAPALNVLGTGAFLNESLPDLSCFERPVYSFTQNSGVQFDNDAAGFFTTSYTFELYFKFTDNTGFLRLIDFKNRTSDFGLYATSTELFFYDELAVNTTAIGMDQYVHLVLSREGVSEEVKMYLNGALVGTFPDTAGSALPNGANVINFFQDDLVFGGEARPGNIALMKFYDYPIGDSAVASNFSNLETTSEVVAFSSDIQTGCLPGNVFNFTNESQNTALPAYTWEFGDGNFFTGTDASHSYITDGTFTVLLIADDGAGCVDSVSSEVSVFISPVIDFGPDFGFCVDEQVLLDAGPGYVSYLWSDSSTDSTLLTDIPGFYSVVAVDTNGCSATDTVGVFLYADPAFTLGTDTTICFGTTVDLVAPLGMADYLWNTSENTQSITVNNNGTFSVEVNSIDGCYAADTIVVSVNPLMVVSVGNDTTICDGQVVTLDPGSGFVSYLWSDGSSGSTLDINAAGPYTVTVTDSFGCTAEAFINLFVNTAPVVDLGVDVTICGGSTLLLDAGPGFSSYLWDDGSSSQTLLVSSQGVYTVTVTDAIGCEGSDIVVVSTDPLISLGNDIVICDGQIATLDPVIIYTTYLWSDGSTNPTLDVTLPGTYTLTVTDINGCINSDEIDVSFNQAPIVDLGAAIDFCIGDSTVLDAGAGFTSYLWNDGSTNQTLTVLTGGTYTVTVTEIGGCFGIDSVTVTIIPPPVVNLGPDLSICDGTASVLDAGPGMNTYLWDDGSTSQMLLIFAAGSYTVTVTDGSGCSAIDEITVSTLTNPTVTLANDTIVCFGDSVLVDAGAGFNAYLWNDGTTNQTIYASVMGNYTVTVTDVNGCQDFDDIELSLYPQIPQPLIVQIGNTLQSSSATGNQWYSATTGIIAGATGVIYDPLMVEDTYYVIVSDTNGCESEPSLNFVFIIDGIEQVNAVNFTVAPNPANDLVEINFTGTTNGKATLELINLQGKTVYTASYDQISKERIDLSSYSQGIYFIRITVGNYSTNRKLIISR